MGDRGGVGRTLARELERLGCDVLLVKDAPQAEALVGRIGEWAGDKPIQGVYWLPALDVEGDLSLMSLEEWREALRVRVKLLYATIRAVEGRTVPSGVFLVSATRLGGQHGYDEAGAVAPLGGAVTGFAKAWKRERPEVLVKAVDFEAASEAPEIAELLLAETRLDPGVVEVGYKDGLRFSVGLEERHAADGRPGMSLGPESVFLVTGAAGAIVSAITGDLAAASGGTFHLLDLVPEPDPANPDLARFGTDKDGLKRDIFERLSPGRAGDAGAWSRRSSWPSSGRWRPGRHRGGERAGGRAHWYACDLRDGAAVGRPARPFKERSPRIDVAPPRGRPGDQPLPEGQGAPGVRPGLRREGRWLVQRAPGPRRHADRRHGGLQLHRRALRQRRPDRLQRRQRPAVQDDLQLAHHAARDARHRPRLDGLGRHRHGQPWLDPQDDGAGGHRHAPRRLRHSR